MAALGPGTENDTLDHDAPVDGAQGQLELEDTAEFEAWLDELAGVNDPAFDAWADARDAAYEAAMERDDADA
jgi:hypothetical protein